MTTIQLISIILVFLLIIGITLRKSIFCIIRKHQDTKLRMWCIKQASKTNVSNSVDPDKGSPFSTEECFVSLAEKYYLFLTEHISYLSDEEKIRLFPHKTEGKTNT